MNETPRQRHVRLLKQVCEATKPLFYGIPGGDSPEDIKALFELWTAHLIDGVPRYDEKGAPSDLFNVSSNLRGRTQLAEWEKPASQGAQSGEPTWGKEIIHWGKVAGAVVSISAASALVLAAVLWALS